MKRRRRQNPKDSSTLFQPTDSAFNLEETAREGFGQKPSFSADSKVLVEDLDIFEIMPDTKQPRRAIPGRIRAGWDNKPGTIVTLFSNWIQAVEEERGASLDLHEYFTQIPEDNSSQSDELKGIPGRDVHNGFFESSLLNIVDLAASIYQDGLTNPITVVPAKNNYLIETGERRWLAYHLLNMYLGEQDDSWSRIPARVMSQTDVWRQASENNARSDLNAIARARQLALLIMDIHGSQNFKQIEEFENEQDFYAQVADGQKWRIPRNQSEKILIAMGLKHSKQIIQYRKLLSLPSEIWQAADELNWPEGRLRGLTTASVSEALQRACRWARKEGYKGTIVTLCGEQRKRTARKHQYEKWSHQIKRVAKALEQMERYEREKLLDELQEILGQYRS